MVESPRQEREIRSRSLAPGDAPRELVAADAGKTRILDFLHRPHEQDGEMGGFAPQMRDLSALSSWAIFRRKFLPRWLFPFQKRSAGGADRQTGLGSGGARKPKEISFDIGMGVGMAFMLFRWATELNKIKELRIQMEMLLKEIKDEIPKKGDGFCILRSNHDITSSSSDCSGNASKCNQNQGASCHMEEAKSTMESDRHSNYVISTEKRNMDQLEAE